MMVVGVLRCILNDCLSVAVILVRMFILVYGINIVRVLVNESFCSDENSLKVIHQMCVDFVYGRTSGNVCSLICETEEIRYKTCIGNSAQKTVVFMTMDGQTVGQKETMAVVLKTESDVQFESVELPIEVHHNGSNSKHAIQFVKERVQTLILNQHRDNNLEAAEKIRSNTFPLLGHLETKQNITPKVLTFNLKTILGLASQKEYLFSSVHSNIKLLPSILGTCGLFYIMEYVPQSEALQSSEWYTSDVPWSKRRDTAIKLLQLIRTLEEDFVEVLHFCDIKAENFGVEKDGSFKIIDADSLAFQSSLQRSLLHRKCFNHVDCDFVKCRGWCNNDTRMCTGHRLNNNLQSLCEEILANSERNGYSGLLRNPPLPIAEELTHLLVKCANPTKFYDISPSEIRASASSEVYIKIMEILLRFQ